MNRGYPNLVKMHPAKWMTLRNIVARPFSGFIDCLCRHSTDHVTVQVKVKVHLEIGDDIGGEGDSEG